MIAQPGKVLGIIGHIGNDSNEDAVGRLRQIAEEIREACCEHDGGDDHSKEAAGTLSRLRALPMDGEIVLPG